MGTIRPISAILRSGQGPEKDRELIGYLSDRTPYLMQMRDREPVLVPLSRSAGHGRITKGLGEGPSAPAKMRL
jgi:hypothetical protein